MSEREKDHSSPDSPVSSTDYSALYEEQHPDAVKDEGKAHYEAVAGARYENAATESRNSARAYAEEAQKLAYSVSSDSSTRLDTADKHMTDAAESQELARQKEDEAGEIYDRAQAILDQTKPRS